jgi:ribosomal-protein-alanine N-acetyltransferase
MTFRFRPMSQSEAETIARWHYPEPYSFYDWSAEPSDLAELLDPTARGGAYFAVHDEIEELAGYFSFKARDPGTLVIGLGLRPDRTGRGLGEAFVRAGLDYAERRFAPKTFVLAVARFNRRAITVYVRSGFVATRVYMHETNGADWEFVEMRRPCGARPA